MGNTKILKEDEQNEKEFGFAMAMALGVSATALLRTPSPTFLLATGLMQPLLNWLQLGLLMVILMAPIKVTAP